MSDGPSPDAQLWQLVKGAMATQAVCVATELGIADELADGPLPVAELAERTGANADALHRFLRALASEGTFAEETTGVFRNTPSSERLRRDAGWRDLIPFFGNEWYSAFADALHAVHTGEATFPRRFGRDWWTWLSEHPSENERFNRGMHGDAVARVDDVASLEWGDAETIVDVGGGNGSLLVELLRRRPRLRGVVFDLPGVVREAEQRIAAAGVADRCRVVAGSFYDGVPAGGDAYVLSRILHGLGDDDARELLRRIRAAAPDGARLVVLDAVIPPGNEPHGNKWLDLLMLVLLGGRERDAEQWRALLDAGGFEAVRLEDGLIEARCR